MKESEEQVDHVEMAIVCEVYGNGNLGENAGWVGDTWVMRSSRRWSPGDKREQSEAGMIYEIPRENIVSGPAKDGICANGLGQAWKVIARFSNRLGALKHESKMSDLKFEKGEGFGESPELRSIPFLPDNVRAERLEKGLLLYALGLRGEAIALTYMPD